jgi:hypothetical protein
MLGGPWVRLSRGGSSLQGGWGEEESKVSRACYITVLYMTQRKKHASDLMNDCMCDNASGAKEKRDECMYIKVFVWMAVCLSISGAWAMEG